MQHRIGQMAIFSIMTNWKKGFVPKVEKVLSNITEGCYLLPEIFQSRDAFLTQGFSKTKKSTEIGPNPKSSTSSPKMGYEPIAEGKYL